MISVEKKSASKIMTLDMNWSHLIWCPSSSLLFFPVNPFHCVYFPLCHLIIYFISRRNVFVSFHFFPSFDLILLQSWWQELEGRRETSLLFFYSFLGIDPRERYEFFFSLSPPAEDDPQVSWQINSLSKEKESHRVLLDSWIRVCLIFFFLSKEHDASQKNSLSGKRKRCNKILKEILFFSQVDCIWTLEEDPLSISLLSRFRFPSLFSLNLSLHLNCDRQKRRKKYCLVSVLRHSIKKKSHWSQSYSVSNDIFHVSFWNFSSNFSAIMMMMILQRNF